MDREGQTRELLSGRFWGRSSDAENSRSSLGAGGADKIKDPAPLGSTEQVNNVATNISLYRNMRVCRVPAQHDPESSD